MPAQEVSSRQYYFGLKRPVFEKEDNTMQKHIHEIYFSQLLGKRIYDNVGKCVGKVKDCVVLWDGDMPRVTGIRHTDDMDKLIPAEIILKWNEPGIKLLQPLDQSALVGIRHQELYVGKWLLDKQVIDLKGYKLVRVNDILLSCYEQEGRQHLSLIAADVGVRGLLRRIGLELLVKHLDNHYILWQSITPLEQRTGSLKLNQEKNHFSKLHPADIADLVEEMDYNSRAAFFNSLNAEQAAETLAEMELDTQVEIITQLDDEQASDLLEDMPPDAAADILGEMSKEKSTELLRLMEADEAEEVKELMQYDEDTAGGLMTTEYIALPVSLTAEQTINRLRKLAPAAETIYYLYVTDVSEKLLGVLSLRELIIAQPDATLDNLMHPHVISVHCNNNHRKVAETIHKYGLLAVPVTDENGVLLGIVTVDDVLDWLMPERTLPDSRSIYLNKRAVRRG